MKKKKQLLLIVAIGLLAGPIAAQADFNFELVDHPDTDATQVFDINDRGDVVGNGIDLGSLPFVFASKKGTLTDVLESVDHDNTAVLGINDAGIMVGSVDNDAFIRDKKGNFTVFSHLGAFSSTQARGVNNKGLVSGFIDTAFGGLAGFIYDPKSDTFTDIIPTSVSRCHGSAGSPFWITRPPHRSTTGLPSR